MSILVSGAENNFAISGLEITKYFSHKHKLNFLFMLEYEKIRAPVAQLVEHRAVTREVASSTSS